MKRTASGLGIITLLAILVTTPVRAQELEHGTWRGTLTPPTSVDDIPVSFEVGETAGALSIVMSAPLVEPPMVFNDVKLQGDELTFWWAPDVRLDCTLVRTEDGSFEGICTDGSGPDGEGILKMRPPSRD